VGARPPAAHARVRRAISDTLRNFADVYQAQKLGDKAAALRQRGLALMEKTLGSDHPHVARYLGDLAL
jgi:hypothetical protein